jgi:uncharacterized iron-regulated membrane protein
MLWLDPVTAEVLAAQRWNQADVGAQAVSIVYPLHTGVLGGVPLQALMMLSGTTLAGMAVTGLWLWWRRRSLRAARKGVGINA